MTGVHPFQLELCADLTNTFFQEFAKPREFLFVDGGQEVIVTTMCVWDTEALKQWVEQLGLFRGSVRCHMHKNVFRTEPKPEQIIYSPCRPYRIGWRIVDITDEEECYVIDLDKLIA